MARAIAGLCALGLIVGMLVGGADAPREAFAAETVVIQVSPSTIYIGSLGGGVTVHAEIPYSTVAGASVTLNGLPVRATFADNRGELVAKFDLAAVKDIIAPPSAELTLTGLTKDGVPFTGTDIIRVVAAK